MKASVQRLSRTIPILRRPDDRWLGPVRSGTRVSAMMMLVLVVSVAIHAGLVATALLTDRQPRPTLEREIAVEIVREAPPALAPKAAEKPVLRTAAEPEPSKPERRQQADPVAKTEPAKTEPTDTGPTKTGPGTGDDRAEPKQPNDAVTDLAAMRQELASLRIEQAALEAARDAARAPPPVERVGPHSFEAIALPATSETGEATGYESLVFSQLFRAKEAHRHEGQPGTATIVFKVDAAGRLVDAAVALPSGIAALDREALQLIREAAPFPPPPAGSRRDFSANVSFVVGAHD